MVPWQSVLEKLSRVLFRFCCHQDPSILMIIEDKTIWLCPRCTGLHIGFLFTYVQLLFSANRRIQIIGYISRMILTLCIGSIAFDWGLGGRLGCFQSTTSTRLLTGMMCGTSMSILVMSYRNRYRRIWIRSPLRLTGLYVVGMHCVSTCGGLIVIGFGNWAIVSSILLASFLVNAIIVIFTIGLIIYRRSKGTG
jgi:uncharacterized membrane protein